MLELEEAFAAYKQKTSKGINFLFQEHITLERTKFGKYEEARKAIDDIIKENIAGAVDGTQKLTDGLIKLLNSFQNSGKLDVIEEAKMFERDHLETEDYFISLYWWLVTVFQVFKMSQTKLWNMGLDIFSSRKALILKKVFKKTLKASTIAFQSVKGAAEATSLLYRTFTGIQKRHKAKKQQNMTGSIYDITKHILCDQEFHEICAQICMNVLKQLKNEDFDCEKEKD